MSQASVGLVALWTGELCANVEHIRNMAIHKMDDAELDLFAKYVRDAGQSITSLAKYVKECQENS
jgi:hypothetical protein